MAGGDTAAGSPAAPAFAAACVGALLGLSASVPWWLAAAVAAGLFVLPLLPQTLLPSANLRALAILGAAASLAATLGAVRRDHHEATIAALPDEAVWEGVVVDDTPSADHGRNLTLEVTGVLGAPGQALPPTPLAARLRVALRRGAGAAAVEAGDRVRVLGRLKPLHPADRPGAFDAALFGLARGLHGRLGVYDARRIAVMERNAGGGAFSRARASLRERLFALSTPRQAGVVLALLVGETATFDEEQHAIYRAVGAGHLLAVSGLQVTLLAMLFFGLARLLLGLIPALGRRSRTRPWAVLIALVGVWGFVLLCGAPPSCVRAGGMATAGLVALLLDRTAAGLDAVGIAGLVTVLLAPESVVDPSFLLSYAAVIGLLLASVRPETSLLEQGKGQLAGQVSSVLLGAGGAGLLTLPVSAHLFGEVSIGGIVANVVLVPAASLLQVPSLSLGLLGALVESAFLVELGAACAGILEALCEGLGGLLGGVVELRAPSGPVTLGFTVAIAFVVVGVAQRRRVTALAGAALVAACGLWATWTPSGVHITVLPVGQGDGAVVTFPDDTVMVIDGGGVWDEHRDPGEEVVTPHLRRSGIERIDIVALSHPDPDHLLGLLTVFKQHEVGELWHSGHGEEHPLIKRLLAAARAQGTRVRVARELLGAHRFGDAVVEVLAPRPEDGALLYEELTPNDNSLVLRIGLGDDRALWPGDVEAWGEEYLMRDRPDIAASVLKAPHHGSRTSSTPAFVQAVAPAHVVFPTGRGNMFGFPHAPVLERYRAAGATLWDTAVHGQIDLWLTGDGVVIDPYLDAELDGGFTAPVGRGGVLTPP